MNGAFAVPGNGYFILDDNKPEPVMRWPEAYEAIARMCAALPEKSGKTAGGNTFRFRYAASLKPNHYYQGVFQVEFPETALPDISGCIGLHQCADSLAISLGITETELLRQFGGIRPVKKLWKHQDQVMAAALADKTIPGIIFDDPEQHIWRNYDFTGEAPCCEDLAFHSMVLLYLGMNISVTGRKMSDPANDPDRLFHDKHLGTIKRLSEVLGVIEAEFIAAVNRKITMSQGGIL